MFKDFEDFLTTKHCEKYIGTKDGCIEDFDSWLQNIEVDLWIEYGDEYANQISSQTKKEVA